MKIKETTPPGAKYLSKLTFPLAKFALTISKVALQSYCLNCRWQLDQKLDAPKQCSTLCDDTLINDLCRYCRHLQNLSKLKQNHCCLRCSLPFETPVGESSSTRILCAECQLEPPAFSRCIASSIYEGVPAQLVRRCKHQAKTAAIKTMAEQLVLTLRTRSPCSSPAALADCLVPVPLHPARERKRGFNQAKLLANELGKQLDIEVISDSCKRIKNNPGQQTLSRRARKQNLQGAFKANASAFVGKRVVIVDDVVTTGETANELTRELLRKGAIECQVWCYARTGKNL